MIKPQGRKGTALRDNIHKAHRLTLHICKPVHTTDDTLVYVYCAAKSTYFQCCIFATFFKVMLDTQTRPHTTVSISFPRKSPQRTPSH